MHFSRQLNCWSLRCSWSNYIFILNLTPGFNGLSKDNYKIRRETFKFWDLVCLILETLWYIWNLLCIKFHTRRSDVLNFRMDFVWIDYTIWGLWYLYQTMSWDDLAKLASFSLLIQECLQKCLWPSANINWFLFCVEIACLQVMTFPKKNSIGDNIRKVYQSRIIWNFNSFSKYYLGVWSVQYLISFSAL